MLQHNPMLARMRGSITKRILNELGKKADKALHLQAVAFCWLRRESR